MHRFLFLILYTLLLTILWPGRLLAECSGLWPFPPLWVNILLLPGCILIFAAAIYAAAGLCRRWKVHETEDSEDWTKRRIGSRPLPDKSPTRPDGKNAAKRFFADYTIIALVLAALLSDSGAHYRQCVQNGHFLSADTVILQWMRPNAGILYQFCNNNPQIFSTSERQEQAVSYLLEKGYHPNARAWHGGTAIEACLHQSNRHLLPLMLKYGGNLNDISPETLPPAAFAASESDADFLCYLLKNGADANASVHGLDYRKTPLHYAVSQNSHYRTECTRLLLEAGAEVNTLNAAGETALDMLSRMEWCDTMRIVQEYGGMHACDLPISMKATEHDLTAKLKTANPHAEDADMAGIIVQQGHNIPYSYHHTGKGNAFIVLSPNTENELRIRCYDGHDDGEVYRNFWAQITLEDVNADRHRDIVVKYTRQSETASQHTDVYHYHTDKRCFTAAK